MQHAWECRIAGSKTGSIGQLHNIRRTVYVIATEETVNDAAIKAAYRPNDIEHILVETRRVLPVMSASEAWGFAATWGATGYSVEESAMYNFTETFVMASEEHRQMCLRHITQNCRPDVETNPEHFESDELANLARFELACTVASVRA